LPKLVHHGFSGAIHATPATIDLAGVMMSDSAQSRKLRSSSESLRRFSQP
jgi:metallo-beta-lactamase family protein